MARAKKTAHPGPPRSPSQHNSQSPSPSGSDSENGESEVKSLKRRLEFSELKLEELKGGKKKTTSVQSLGRGICRLASLFIDVRTLVRAHFDHGNQPNAEAVETLTEEQKKECLQKEKEAARDLKSYEIICQLVPTFSNRVDTEELDDLFEYCDKLQSGARAARSDDINSLKEAVAHFLNYRPMGHSAVPLLKHDDRVGRGYTNDLTGRLLTPIQFDWDNPLICQNIRSKTLVVSNSYFLRAFYYGEKGDPDDVEHNFLKSTLLLQTWRHIFVANGSVDSSIADSDDHVVAPLPVCKRARKSTRKNVAQLLDMKEVSPRSIAYACVMLRFSLSDANAWNADQSFNYQGLYNTIIDYFEDVESGSEAEKDVHALLDWWTKNAFVEPDASTNEQPVLNFANTIQEQRALKTAKRAERATATASR
ncbi:hypothetical protein EV360DRAFT_87390 [Lentinula raphanica]|nr:hypothetical protein EV360DRAFT_87390 [Lentinula raphanica]